MQKIKDLLIFSPSDLIRFQDSKYASWMERFSLETDIPDFKKNNVDQDDALNVFLQKKGFSHEDDYTKSLKKQKLNIIEIGTDKGKKLSDEEKLKLTIAAMKEGRDIIVQGFLTKGNFRGTADYLRKTPGKSNLGEYHYVPIDTKLARSLKPYYMIQLSCYCEMLESIQGKRPDDFSIVLGDKSEVSLKVDDYYYYYQFLKEDFEKFQTNFDKNTEPNPDDYKNFGNWSEYAHKKMGENHLINIANIRRDQIKKLNSVGIKNIPDLLKTKTPPKDLEFRSEIFEKLKKQATLQGESKGEEIPRFEILPPATDKKGNMLPRGLNLLPPFDQADLFFDFEGFPLAEDGGLEYLWGISLFEKKKLSFKSLWAHNPEEEQKALIEFIDFAYDRWKKNPKMHIYHYAAYEVSALNRLVGKYGVKEDELLEMLEKEVFVDLFAIIRNGLLVGTPDYSLKSIEKLYLDASRTGEVLNAGASMVKYSEFAENPDSTEGKKILAEILKYNKDDCDSTFKCADFLRKEQKKAGIKFPEQEDSGEQIKTPNFFDELKEKILKKMKENPEKGETYQLLYYLVSFYHREGLPSWAMHKIRQEMDETDLLYDFDCLAFIQRKKFEPSKLNLLPAINPKFFEGIFDPSQETKLKEGDNCRIYGDSEVKVQIKKIDIAKGTIGISVEKGQISGNLISLIPYDEIFTQNLEKAKNEIIEKYLENDLKNNPIIDFLHRNTPRLKGKKKFHYDPETSTLDDLIPQVLKMDNSILSIQGPPGTGKTHTAAQLINALVENGHKVAVSANSHKTILAVITRSLMESKDKKNFNAIKLKKKPEDDNVFEEFKNQIKVLENPQIKYFPAGYDSYPIVGGTAFDLCKEPFRDYFDYLIVDEASQVSIPNLMAMSRSCKNIILIGDQQQLPQPLKGAHPGLSSQSCLEYYLKSEKTVRPDEGVFLAKTRRLHPDICKIISDCVYEGRLHSLGTDKRIIQEKKGAKEIPFSSGVIYYPVPHTGNSQDSPEEAQAIKKIIEELKTRKKTDKQGKVSDMDIKKDIMIVVPYNLQLNRLTRELGGDMRIGTVDKFQGLEAAVSILSMCSSSGDDSPRGLNFIMDPKRLNVGLSRGESLSIIVANPELVYSTVTSIENMKLLNTYCRIIRNSKNKL